MGPTTGVVYVRRHDSSHSFSSSFSDMSEKSFLKRMFARKVPQINLQSSRRTSSKKYHHPYHHHQDEDDSSSDSDTIFVMTPNPACHPLLSKPVARDEVRPRPPTRSIGAPRLKTTIKKIEKPDQSECLSDDSQKPTRISGIEMYKRNLREREKAAMAAAIDRKYVQEWGFFIKCYSEGRFNVSNPPDPPPRRPEFNHLTAPAPPHERQRLKAVRTCNVPLPLATQEKCNRLTLLARKVFQTRMATISLIDENLEIFKAEHSFGRKYVDRADSIGAHVLLAAEPMVVLDTMKDWRLRGNPLVQGGPHIRFYAGVPITTFQGHPIGVFAVFDTQPRTSFPVTSRRNLMDFAKLAMTEFEMVMEERDLLKKHMPTKIIGQTKVSSDDDNDGESIASRRTRLTAKLLKGIEENAENMPPLSPFFSDQIPELFLDSPTMPEHPQDTFITKPKDLSLLSESFDFSSTTKQVTRSAPASRGRDSTSMSSPEQQENNPYFVITKSSSSSPASSGNLAASQTIINSSLPRYKQNRPLPLQTKTLSNFSELHPPPSVSTPMTPITPLMPQASPGSLPRLSEAKFATAMIARSLDYDFVYLLRVTSAPASESPLLPVDRYRPKASISTKILVAHGLPDPPPTFDAALHLRALRSQGGLVFQNPVSGGERDEVGFQVGVMLPLAREGGCEHRKSDDCLGDVTNCIKNGDVDGGIVLAAFSAKEATDKEQPIRPDEIRFLREFGDGMKDIFVMADKRAKKLF